MKRWMMMAAIVGASVLAPATAHGATNTELVYADGHTYQMVGATLVTNASPGLLTAPPLYVLVFPVTGTAPVTLPSGYQPQCNPCSQEPFAFHDHLITGEPGQGTAGTAGGDYRAPWRLVIMRYTLAYATSLDFTPVTSDSQLAAAESQGEFTKINPDPSAPDPYQIWTPNVLICPVVGFHAA